MPPKPRKLLVTRRKLEFYILRHRFGFDGFCPVCREERHFVAVEEAMSLTNTSMLSVFAAVSAGEMHYIESHGGVLMICEESLCAVGGPLVRKLGPVRSGS
jgi:hypothetical protein